jgi:hypothetical protein
VKNRVSSIERNNAGSRRKNTPNVTSPRIKEEEKEKASQR